MAGVKAGGDRQELHEAIRQHSMECARRMKEQGLENDLLERIRADPVFAAITPSLSDLLDPKKYVGCAPTQVDAFLKDKISFLGMSDIIETCMSKVPYIAKPDYDSYVTSDNEARRMATALL